MRLSRRIDAAERLLAAARPDPEVRPIIPHLTELRDKELRRLILEACDRVERHDDPEARALVARTRARLQGA